MLKKIDFFIFIILSIVKDVPTESSRASYAWGTSAALCLPNYRDLLTNCLCGNTQNPYESFNVTYGPCSKVLKTLGRKTLI